MSELSSAVYRVVAPLVLVRDDAGKVHYAYQDALVRLLPDQEKQFVEENLVVESDVEPDDDDGKPGSGATKNVLVAWLVEHASQDDGSDFVAEDLQKLTKDKLWDLINAVE